MIAPCFRWNNNRAKHFLVDQTGVTRNRSDRWILWQMFILIWHRQLWIPKRQWQLTFLDSGQRQWLNLTILTELPWHSVIDSTILHIVQTDWETDRQNHNNYRYRWTDSSSSPLIGEQTNMTCSAGLTLMTHDSTMMTGTVFWQRSIHCQMPCNACVLTLQNLHADGSIAWLI